MADAKIVSQVSVAIDTGSGQLWGIVISSSSGTAALATFYDNTSASGTKLFEAYVSINSPVIIFFTGRYVSTYSTGLYLSLGSNLTATAWYRTL